MKVTGVIVLTFIVFVGIDGGTWIPANNDMKLPYNSVHAGYEDQWRVYVGRIHHPTDGYIAAKLVNKNTNTACSYSYVGQQLPCIDFDILTGYPGEFFWVPQLNGQIPQCGFITNGRFGIGRGLVRGNTVVGKIVPLLLALYAGYSGTEHRLTSYDSLREFNCSSVPTSSLYTKQ